MPNSIANFHVLKTGVSKAYWCAPDADGRLSFMPAKISGIGSDSEEISWLDELFEGGIHLPKLPGEDNRAMTMLLTGSPGSGKSTLALELCYRWTRNKQMRDKGLDSLYVTTETNESWIIDKANSFRWQDAANRIVGISDSKGKGAIPLVTIWPTTDFDEYFKFVDLLGSKTKAILGALKGLIPFQGDVEPICKELRKKIDKRKVKKRLKINKPDILVIDSLNTIEPSKRPDLFNAFTQLSSLGPRIILIILDSGASRSTYEFWEYISDIVIRLDKRYVYDYMVRTIEILKARFQSHIWGVHQLKIYSGYREHKKDQQALRRAHPYREDGGIFIFPSIHYYLSAYKRRFPQTEPEPTTTGLKKLDDVLKGGFQKGRCNGLIGCRGGHKSHLGYLHLLSKLVNSENGKGLVISLRDDEGIARGTMTSILNQQFPKENVSLDQFIREDRLESLYYPPGYITPEEFFHRVFMSIQRLKRGKGDVDITVLFNSLDQLSSRFPLCAKEEIFIPGIIETFSAEGITSIFIAVEEPGQPPEQYGLLSMADVILSFGQQKFGSDDYCGHLNESLEACHRLKKNQLESCKKALGKYKQVVVLRVVRCAGGYPAGAGGILELIDKESAAYALYKEEGLHFVPFSPRYSKRKK